MPDIITKYIIAILTIMTLKLYGIPTCGTCKKAMQWLEQNQIDTKFIDTKKFPPNPEQVIDWVQALGAKALRNTSGQSYRALPPDRADWSDAQWIKAYSDDAMLIKRPVWVLDGQPILVGFRIKEADLRELLGLNSFAKIVQ